MNLQHKQSIRSLENTYKHVVLLFLCCCVVVVFSQIETIMYTHAPSIGLHIFPWEEVEYGRSEQTSGIQLPSHCFYPNPSLNGPDGNLSSVSDRDNKNGLWLHSTGPAGLPWG